MIDNSFEFFFNECFIIFQFRHLLISLLKLPIHSKNALIFVKHKRSSHSTEYVRYLILKYKNKSMNSNDHTILQGCVQEVSLCRRERTIPWLDFHN